LDIRLIVLDIDGTIAGESNTVREPVKKALYQAQKQGIAVTLATGRMFHSAKRFYREISGSFPLIAYNGAWIQDPSSTDRHQHLPVPPAIALRLLDTLEQPAYRQQLQIHCYIDDHLYVREITAQTESYIQRAGCQVTSVADLRSLLAQPTTKLLAMGANPQFMTQMLATLQQDFAPTELYLTQSTPTFFEATHPQANKGEAVRYLAEQLMGLKPENVLAIGDNFNDCEMIQYAGIGIAMGDAPEEVKAIADWVAPGVEVDGVVAALERFIL